MLLLKDLTSIVALSYDRFKPSIGKPGSDKMFSKINIISPSGALGISASSGRRPVSGVGRVLADDDTGMGGRRAPPVRHVWAGDVVGKRRMPWWGYRNQGKGDIIDSVCA